MDVRVIKGRQMDYRVLYEKLVAEADESGLGGETVDWEISISKWRSDPVASALHGWLMGNDHEGMAAKPEEMIDWEMGVVATAAEARREEAASSWRRGVEAAGSPEVLGRLNAMRSAANEAMIEEIPEVAF